MCCAVIFCIISRRHKMAKATQPEIVVDETKNYMKQNNNDADKELTRRWIEKERFV